MDVLKSLAIVERSVFPLGTAMNNLPTSALKPVYLFELDSVRSTSRERRAALKALFHTLLVERRPVVLSMNQLIDSRALMPWLLKESTRGYILRLFEKGMLRTVSFVDSGGNTVCTPARYLRKALDKDFVFTWLGVTLKKGDPLAVAMRKALDEFDLSHVSPEAVDVLGLGLAEEQLGAVQSLVRFVLELSVVSIPSQAVRKEGNESLAHYVDEVVSGNPAFDECLTPEVVGEIGRIRGLTADAAETRSRTWWYRMIECGELSDDPGLVSCAKHAIDLCYCYSVQSGIEGVDEVPTGGAFAADFTRRFGAFAVGDGAEADSGSELGRVGDWRIWLRWNLAAHLARMSPAVCRPGELRSKGTVFVLDLVMSVLGFAVVMGIEQLSNVFEDFFKDLSVFPHVASAFFGLFLAVVIIAALDRVIDYFLGKFNLHTPDVLESIGSLFRCFIGVFICVLPGAWRRLIKCCSGTRRARLERTER